jgi:hypothetical protein
LGETTAGLASLYTHRRRQAKQLFGGLIQKPYGNRPIIGISKGGSKSQKLPTPPDNRKKSSGAAS